MAIEKAGLGELYVQQQFDAAQGRAWYHGMLEIKRPDGSLDVDMFRVYVPSRSPQDAARKALEAAQRYAAKEGAELTDIVLLGQDCREINMQPL